MKKTNDMLVFVFLIWVLSLTGCNRISVSTPDSPEGTYTAARGTLPVPTLHLVPTEASTPSTAISPTFSPAGKSMSCLQENEETRLEPAPFSALPGAVLEYLNRGGTLSRLDQSLYDLNAASQPVSVAAEDMTGDGRVDVVVSVYDSSSTSLPPSGRLMIYLCRGGKYELAYTASSADFTGAPGIRFLQDLDNDGRAELVSGSAQCGASTCFEEVKILSWDGNSIENRLQGTTSDLPSPVLELVEEQDTGIYQLEVTAGGIGSVGAGPQRSLTRTYARNAESGRWEQESEIPGPSNYRIHVLHDAESAAQSGELSEALRLYQRVISDSTLDDWMDPASEQEQLAAYARLKMIMVYYQMGQTEFARVAYNQLEAESRSESILHPYVELANEFIKGWEQAGLESGCREVDSYFIEKGEGILEALGPQTFGYANDPITPEEVCPW